MMDTKQLILKLLQDQGPAGPSAIALSLQISTQMVHRHQKARRITQGTLFCCFAAALLSISSINRRRNRS